MIVITDVIIDSTFNSIRRNAPRRRVMTETGRPSVMEFVHLNGNFFCHTEVSVRGFPGGYSGDKRYWGSGAAE